MHHVFGAAVDVGGAALATSTCAPCLQSLGASPAVATLGAALLYVAARLVVDEVKAWRARQGPPTSPPTA